MATLGALGVVYGDIGGLGEMTHLEGLDAHAQHKARERGFSHKGWNSVTVKETLEFLLVAGNANAASSASGRVS
jgi:hypothetical protein